MLCPVEGWGQTAGISRWGMNTMPTFLVGSWCQDLLTHDLTSQWRGFQFHRNSGHLSNISATEIVRSSVLTNKIANSKQRNNGTISMPATVKPQFLTLLRWRQRSCQGWSCRVTSPQQEVVCIGDYQTITLYMYIYIYIFFVGFQVCPVGNVGSCPAPLDAWCLVPWRSQTVHIHMPCTWTIMNPRYLGIIFQILRCWFPHRWVQRK